MTFIFQFVRHFTKDWSNHVLIAVLMSKITIFSVTYQFYCHVIQQKSFKKHIKNDFCYVIQQKSYLICLKNCRKISQIFFPIEKREVILWLHFPPVFIFSLWCWASYEKKAMKTKWNFLPFFNFYLKDTNECHWSVAQW